MAQSRLRISKQLEKSLVASSLILTDSNREAAYLAPGTEGQVLKILAGVAQYADEGSSAFSISDGTNTQVVNAGDTVLFEAGDGLTVLVGATDKVTYAVKLSADPGNDVTFGADGGVYLSKNNLVKGASWDDATNTLIIEFEDGSTVDVPIVDNIASFLSDFSISDGVTTTLISNHGTVTYAANNLLKVVVSGSTVSYEIDTTDAPNGAFLQSQGEGEFPEWVVPLQRIRQDFSPTNGDTTISLAQAMKTDSPEVYPYEVFRNGSLQPNDGTVFTVPLNGSVLTFLDPFTASPGAEFSERVTVIYFAV